MPKFRKKPVVIEAVQFDGNGVEAINELAVFCPVAEFGGYNDGSCYMAIQTLGGEMRACTGDWIIKGVNGEFYPCKPDIFEKTYEAVQE